jgi:hypothetical protein
MSKMKNLFESVNGTFSTRGNGTFPCLNGVVTRTGWKKSRLGDVNKAKIINALNDSWVDKVFKINGKLYKLMLNGNTVSL